MGTLTWADPAHGLGAVFLVQAICTNSSLSNRVRNVIGAAAGR